MEQRIEALRLFRGNGEAVGQKLALLDSKLPPIQKPCLDADLEVRSERLNKLGFA